MAKGIIRTPEQQRQTYLKWKENTKLRKAGLAPPPFKAENDQQRHDQRIKLQKERRLKHRVPKQPKPSKEPKPKPVKIPKPLKSVKPPKVYMTPFERVERRREYDRKYQAARKKRLGFVPRVKMTAEEKRVKHLEAQKAKRALAKSLKPPKQKPVPKVKVIVPKVPKPKAPRKLPVGKKEKEPIVKLPTLNRDLSEMVAVFIPERKMTVYVKKGRNIDKVREKYKIVNNLKM